MRESPMKCWERLVLVSKERHAARMTVIDNVRSSVSRTDAREMQLLARQPGLHGVAGELRGNRLENAKNSGDRNECGMKFLADHPRGELTARAGHRASAQRTVNME